MASSPPCFLPSASSSSRRALFPAAWAFLALMSLMLRRAAPQSTPDDPCSTLSLSFQVTSRFLVSRPFTVLPCTQSVPFDRRRDLGTLDSVTNSLRSFYAHLHAAQQSPEPRLPSNYDVVQALQNLKKRQWSSAEDFYDAVSRAVGMLNDGHTQMLPNCPPFAHRLALSLVSVVEDEKNVIRVAPASMLSSRISDLVSAAPFYFNASAYAGALVDTIEGVPAWQYMLDWVNKNPLTYHDVGQRINNALASFAYDSSDGSQVVSPGAFVERSSNPRRNFLNISITLKGQSTAIRVPWISLALASQSSSFLSTYSYYNAFCAPGDSNVFMSQAVKGGKGRRAPRSFDPLSLRMSLPQSPQHRMLDPLRARVKPVAQLGTPSQESTLFFPVYDLIESTAVVCLHTFAPEPPSSSPDNSLAALEFFTNQIADSLTAANRTSKRVIIDLSGNGGGLVAGITVVMEMLLGTTKLLGNNRLARTPFSFLAETGVVEAMRKRDVSFYNHSTWNTLQGNSFSAQDDFFLPLQQLTFGAGGRPGTYSNFFTSATYTLGQLEGSSRVVEPFLGDKPFVLFSNGICYSACTLFATAMKLGFGIQLVTAGGVKGSPMAFGGGGGGFVADVEKDLMEMFPYGVLVLPAAPKPFGVGAAMSVGIASGFLYDEASGAPKTDVPLEFVFTAGDAHLDYNMITVDDPNLMYLMVPKDNFSTPLAPTAPSKGAPRLMPMLRAYWLAPALALAALLLSC